MRHFFVKLWVLSALTVGGAAQAEESGSSLMERGAQLFLEGILKEVDPTVKDLQALLQQMGPALAELMGDIEDFSAYHPPEILPNGDIILRKKGPDVAVPPAAPEAEIDL